MKKIEKNLSKALCIIIYFIILFFAYTRMNLDRLAQDIQVFSGAFLVLGILALEKAYRSSNYRDRTISFIYTLFIYYAYDNIIEI